MAVVQNEFDIVISRARKIRCDSTRPICDNCVRRSHGCEYDEKPRRRGPDKRPGTRQRSCKKRPTDGSIPSPKRQKATTERLSEKDQQSNLESSPDSRPLDHYSPKFYANLTPGTHASASNPRSIESNSHSKVCQPFLVIPVLCLMITWFSTSWLLRIVGNHRMYTTKVPTQILLFLPIRHDFPPPIYRYPTQYNSCSSYT
jgi:hypothetical protein